VSWRRQMARIESERHTTWFMTQIRPLQDRRSAA
jgi:hypothetical protein